MRFTVLWLPPAEAELARIWTNLHDRAAIAAAANSIDNLLRNDPQDVGESRYGSGRVLIVTPLTVSFHVKLDDREVEVVSVRYFTRRSS